MYMVGYSVLPVGCIEGYSYTHIYNNNNIIIIIIIIT